MSRQGVVKSGGLVSQHINFRDREAQGARSTRNGEHDKRTCARATGILRTGVTR